MAEKKVKTIKKATKPARTAGKTARKSKSASLASDSVEGGKPLKKVVSRKRVKSTVKERSKKAKKTKKKESEDVKRKYYEAVGRRKRAVARVRLFTKGDKGFSVNKKSFAEHFKTQELQSIAEGALRKMKVVDKFNISVMVRGGGIAGQAEAVRHGTARALLKFNADFRKRLKRAGFLRRDPREKERRKFGLRKARRAPQWSKR